MAYKDPKKEKEYQRKRYLAHKEERKMNRPLQADKEWEEGRLVWFGSKDNLFRIKKFNQNFLVKTGVLERVHR